MAASQNGWSANDRSLTENRQVPGTDVSLRVRKGPAGELLIYVAEQLDRRVESIDNGRGGVDDWGYAERPIRGGWELSNHASGTAIDLNAPRHPLGAVGTFSDRQVTEIHAILRECSGVVRWGGDYTGRRDEMHFEINAGAAAVNAAWQRIQSQPEEDDMWSTDGDIPFGIAYDKHGNEINPECVKTVALPAGARLKDGGIVRVVGDGKPGTITKIRRALNKADKLWQVDAFTVEPQWRAEATTTWFDSDEYGKVSFGRMAQDDLDELGLPTTERDRIAATSSVSYLVHERR